MSFQKIVILAGAGDDGHRAEYASVFRCLFESAGLQVTVEPIGVRQVANPCVLISLMIEDHTESFLALAAARALLGRRTVGLLFMPMPCLQPRSLRHRLKRLALRLLRRLPKAEILTILPISLEPTMGEIVSGGIYDTHLWDSARGTDSDAGISGLSEMIGKQARGRTVLTSLGGQTELKGFDRFVGMWLGSSVLRERFLFVAAGRVDAPLKELARQFEDTGGLVVDRRLTDLEMRSLYSASDLIWACYAPSYDQASGIFGRAVQAGTPAVVRRGSLIHRLASAIGHPTVELMWTSEDVMAEELQAWRPPSSVPLPAELVQSMRDYSIRSLSLAVGHDLTTDICR